MSWSTQSKPLESIPQHTNPFGSNCLGVHNWVSDGYDKHGNPLMHCTKCDAGFRARPPHSPSLIKEVLAEPKPHPKPVLNGWLIVVIIGVVASTLALAVAVALGVL